MNNKAQKSINAPIGSNTAHTINVGATIPKHGNINMPVKLITR